MNTSHNALDPLKDIEQTVLTLGHGQSAALGHGIQNIYYGIHSSSPLPASHITISPPLGRLSKERPLRGRHDLFTGIQGGSGEGRVEGVHVICGLAGSGKTSVALEIAAKSIEAGIQTWWISGNNASSLAMGMRSLASRIGVTDIELTHSDPADALWRRLSQLNQPWLLIVDNVDNPSALDGGGNSFVDGTGWVRPIVGRNGGVLITSRMAAPSVWGSWCSIHQTTMLNVDDGAKMLFDYVPSSAGSIDDARSLSVRLGGLPLAIRLAGLYLAETSGIPWPEPGSIATIAKYQRAMDEGLIPDAESRDVFAHAWHLSLQLLDDRGVRFARQTLYLLSLFAESLFPFRALLHPPTLGEQTPFQGISSAGLWKTINALADLGMVDLVRFDAEQEAPEHLRIHPVVRDVTRIGDPPLADTATYLETAARLVRRAVKDANLETAQDIESWKVWGDLTPHVMLLSRAASSADSTVAAIRELDPAWCTFSDYLIDRGMQADAEELARISIRATEQQLGSQHGVVLHRRFHLALILAQRSKYQEADAVFSALLPDYEQAFGSNSARFLDTRHRYADFLRERGEYAKAERILRVVLAAESDLRGENDPSTLLTKDCLGRILRDKGDLQASLKCYREVLDARTALLGPDHDDTMHTRHHYAHTLANMGQLIEAEELHRQLLDDYISKDGIESPSVLHGRHCLAHLLANRGDLVEAIDQVTIAFEVRRRIYGETHPDTLEVRSCRASLLTKLEQPEAAERELITVIKMLEETLGHEHVQTLSARHELAHAISNAGDSFAAQQAFSRLYALQRRALGPAHAHTRATKYCLEAEKRRASARSGSFPLHGGGKSSGRKKGRKK
ncbi:tetratricopeptide repeat protein [Micromonospora sp. L31]|uniref:tetratricopeptide repeat protein n=1 Tax=Micromonospora sp. L31 TaxID=3452213 RepID=UPI003F889D78